MTVWGSVASGRNGGEPVKPGDDSKAAFDFIAHRSTRGLSADDETSRSSAAGGGWWQNGGAGNRYRENGLAGAVEASCPEAAMSVEANDLLQRPLRVMVAGALLFAALDGAARLGPHPATSAALMTVARTITQDTGSLIHPRASARRSSTGQCPAWLECDGFVWL